MVPKPLPLPANGLFGIFLRTSNIQPVRHQFRKDEFD